MKPSVPYAPLLLGVLVSSGVACGALVGIPDCELLVSDGGGVAHLEGGPTTGDAAYDGESPDGVGEADTGSEQRDAPPPDSGQDAEGGPPASPSSCLDVQNADPAAPSGVYRLVVAGQSFDAYCDMTLDGGGWTAFFVDMLGASHVIGHFDLATKDVCPDPATKCLRRIPSSLDPAARFAAVCGADAVSFSVPPTAIAYFTGVGMAAWVHLTNVQSARGNPNLTYASKLFTGQGTDYGWILSADDNEPNPTTLTFASSFDWISSTWDYCNGVSYNGATGDTPLVMLLYR